MSTFTQDQVITLWKLLRVKSNVDDEVAFRPWPRPLCDVPVCLTSHSCWDVWPWPLTPFRLESEIMATQIRP